MNISELIATHDIKELLRHVPHDQLDDCLKEYINTLSKEIASVRERLQSVDNALALETNQDELRHLEYENESNTATLVEKLKILEHINGLFKQLHPSL